MGSQIVLGSVCQDDLVTFFNRNSERAVPSLKKIEVEAALKSSLSDRKFKALQQSLKLTGKEIYTPGDIVAQNNILKKGGFSPAEITELRKSKILPDTAVQIQKELPSKIASIEVEARSIGVDDIQRLKAGEKLNYIVTNDQHFVVKTAPALADDTVFLAKGTKNSEVTTGSMVSEAGQISYNPTTKKFEFNKNYGISASDKDLKELAGKVSRETGETIEIKPSGGAKTAASKTYDCLDILSAQSSGKNFILNRIVPDNAIGIAGIAVGEALGANRLNTDQGREVIAADLIGTNINVLVGGYIGSKLVLSNASFLSALGTRAAVSMGMIEVQKNVYENMLTTSSNERAEKIATFDQYHFAARLGWNHMFEKFLVGNTSSKFNLPNMIFKACQNNSKMKLLVNPQTVRFVEKGASAAVYYGLRKSIINE